MTRARIQDLGATNPISPQVSPSLTSNSAPAGGRVGANVGALGPALARIFEGAVRIQRQMEEKRAVELEGIGASTALKDGALDAAFASAGVDPEKATSAEVFAALKATGVANVVEQRAYFSTFGANAGNEAVSRIELELLETDVELAPEAVDELIARERAKLLENPIVAASTVSQAEALARLEAAEGGLRFSAAKKFNADVERKLDAEISTVLQNGDGERRGGFVGFEYQLDEAALKQRGADIGALATEFAVANGREPAAVQALVANEASNYAQSLIAEGRVEEARVFATNALQHVRFDKGGEAGSGGGPRLGQIRTGSASKSVTTLRSIAFTDNADLAVRALQNEETAFKLYHSAIVNATAEAESDQARVDLFEHALDQVEAQYPKLITDLGQNREGIRRRARLAALEDRDATDIRSYTAALAAGDKDLAESIVNNLPASVQDQARAAAQHSDLRADTALGSKPYQRFSRLSDDVYRLAEGLEPTEAQALLNVVREGLEFHEEAIGGGTESDPQTFLDRYGPALEGINNRLSLAINEAAAQAVQSGTETRRILRLANTDPAAAAAELQTAVLRPDDFDTALRSIEAKRNSDASAQATLLGRVNQQAELLVQQSFPTDPAKQAAARARIGVAIQQVLRNPDESLSVYGNTPGEVLQSSQLFDYTTAVAEQAAVLAELPQTEINTEFTTEVEDIRVALSDAISSPSNLVDRATLVQGASEAASTFFSGQEPSQAALDYTNTVIQTSMDDRGEGAYTAFIGALRLDSSEEALVPQNLAMGGHFSVDDLASGTATVTGTPDWGWWGGYKSDINDLRSLSPEAAQKIDAYLTEIRLNSGGVLMGLGTEGVGGAREIDLGDGVIAIVDPLANLAHPERTLTGIRYQVSFDELPAFALDDARPVSRILAELSPEQQASITARVGRPAEDIRAVLLEAQQLGRALYSDR